MTHPFIKAGQNLRAAQSEVLKAVERAYDDGWLEGSPKLQEAVEVLRKAREEYRVTQEKTLKEYDRK